MWCLGHWGIKGREKLFGAEVAEFPAAGTEFDYLAVFHIGAVDGEFDEGAYFVSAMVAGGSGVDVEALEFGVEHDFEDVGVACDEEFGWVGGELFSDGGGVFAGIAAYVGHEDIDFFAGPAEGFGKFAADAGAVDVAIDTFEGFEGAETVGEGGGAEVAGVPDLVAVGEVDEDAFVEVVVGV